MSHIHLKDVSKFGDTEVIPPLNLEIRMVSLLYLLVLVVVENPLCFD